MFQPMRLLSGEGYKGTRNYLNTQRVYELLRTLLFFAISGALFLAGFLQTGTRLNLLTVVAVLGCLPASKSLVIFIMFCRYNSLATEKADALQEHLGGLSNMYDLVFTGREKNFPVSHLAIKGDTVCGYSERLDFDEKAFEKHISQILKADSFSNVSVKIFTDFPKYVSRLDQMQELSCDESHTKGIMETLKSVSL